MVAGGVTLAEDVTVWYSAVLRGDAGAIRIGRGSNLQDHVTVHCGAGVPTVVGENVVVGHGAILHSCKVGDGCLIGMGAILLDGCEIGAGAVVSAGAVVPPGKAVPPRSVVMGIPGKVVREVSEAEARATLENAARYVLLGREQLHPVGADIIRPHDKVADTVRPGTAAEEYYMRQALALAEEAALAGEVPVGCVIVREGVIVGRGRNRREEKRSALSHAETEAIAQANAALRSWRLDGCQMYVTLEPCPMCAGAILNARIDRVWFGARDPAMGACGGVLNLFMEDFPNPPALVGGILEEECREALGRFFRGLRGRNDAKQDAARFFIQGSERKHEKV